MHNPSDNHYLVADRVIRYLDGTSTYILEFRNIPETIICIFEGSSDVLFANLEGRKNSKGHYF
jgi:hypothetical protein